VTTAKYGTQPRSVSAVAEVMVFPKPPPLELLEGFKELRVRWSESRGSTSRFAGALLEAPADVQQLAPAVFDFVIDRSAWVKLLEFHGADEASRERLLADLDFMAVARHWSTPMEDGWYGFVRAWVQACRGLPKAAATKNLLKAHRARFPGRWGRP
jgi:hypothetical protein